MRIYGYQFNSEELVELQEMTFLGSIRELDKLIQFLQEVKKQHNEVIGKTEFCHSHYRDWDTEWSEGTADIIVVTDAKCE